MSCESLFVLVDGAGVAVGSGYSEGVMGMMRGGGERVGAWAGFEVARRESRPASVVGDNVRESINLGGWMTGGPYASWTFLSLR